VRWPRIRWLVVTLALGPSLLVALLWSLGTLDSLEDLAFDYAMKRRGPESPTRARVAVVAIDERSLGEVGRWPWLRSKVADLVRAIRKAGARVVAIDLLMAEPSQSPPECDCPGPRVCEFPQADPGECTLNSQDCELAEALAERHDVVLGFILESDLESGPQPEPAGADGSEVTRLQRYAPPPKKVWFPNVAFRPRIRASLPCFNRTTELHGYVTHPIHRGEFRGYGLVQRYGGKTPGETDAYLLPLALSAVARYRGISAELLPDSNPPTQPVISLGDETLPTTPSGVLVIDYLGPRETIHTVSAADLLEGRLSDADRVALDGSLVFVGFTAIGLGDFYPTPFAEQMPGVEIHATVAYNLLTGRFIYDGNAQSFWSLVAVLVLSPLVAQVVRRIKWRLGGAMAGIGVVAVWALIAYLAFSLGHWHLLFVAPMLAGALSLVGNLTHQIGVVDKQRRRLGAYVSPKVRQKITIEGVELTGEENLVTILFCDIRDFSSWSEDKSPETVVRMLNHFFEAMTRIIHDEEGTLDKYTGDGLMAFFGAPYELPDQERRACKAALRMQEALAELRQAAETRHRERSTPDDPLPDFRRIRIGIGLNTGLATVGNTGSQDIVNYTAIGDEVNLASRVEGLTKAFRVDNLVTHETRRRTEDAFLFRPLGLQRVKGIDQPVELFELVAEAPGTPEQQERNRLFEQGLAALFEQRDLDRAAKSFRELKERFEDGPSKLYLERIERWREHSAEFDTWDGVINHTEK
jgi:adenylate cyclase